MPWFPVFPGSLGLCAFFPGILVLTFSRGLDDFSCRCELPCASWRPVLVALVALTPALHGAGPFCFRILPTSRRPQRPPRDDHGWCWPPSHVSAMSSFLACFRLRCSLFVACFSLLNPLVSYEYRG